MGHRFVESLLLFAIFEALLSIEKFIEFTWPIFMLLGEYLLLEMAKYWIAIWSHWP